MIFSKLILDPQNRNTTDTNELKRLVERYPWFYTAKLMLLKRLPVGTPRYRELRKSIGERLKYYPASSIFMQNLSPSIFRQFDCFTIVNKFLESGDFTIKPSQEADNKSDLSESSSFITDDMLTESLAQVLVAQQQFAPAREIYCKLSLKFPEKNAYFASLIREIENKL